MTVPQPAGPRAPVASCGAGPIVLDDRCNLGCTFCGTARRGPRESRTIETELRAAVARGERPLFGGGEPTLDPRLPAWLALARTLGATERQIETNALRCADVAYTHRLRDAGLTHARVMLPAATETTGAAVTRVDDRLELAWQGAKALGEAGVVVAVVVPVARANASELPALVRRVAADLTAVESVVLRPVFFGNASRPGEPAESLGRGPGEPAENLARGPGEPAENLARGLPEPAEGLDRARHDSVPPDALAAALAAALEAAAAVGIDARLDLAGGLPLCALRHWPEALARRVGAPAGHEQPAACAGCALADRCGGQNPIDRAVHGPYPVVPYATMPRRTRGLATTEPVLLFSSGPPSTSRPWPAGARADGPRVPAGHEGKAEIRVTMPCNQRCTFCFVNRDAPDADLAELEGAVDAAVARGVAAIVFTGGEPTLSPHLAALVARARQAHVPLVGIQTNALKLAEGPLAETLVAAGLQHAHVSLHAADPGRYLETTGLGTPDQAARGAARLWALGVDVTFSLVLHRTNADHLGDTLRFLHERLPGALVILSVAREQDDLDRPWDRILLGYAEAGRAFADALDVAADLGQPLRSAGTCALPPCVLPRAALLRHGPKVAVAPRAATWGRVRAGDTFDEGDAHGRLWLPRCEGCALRHACPGLNDRTLLRFGDADVKPIGGDEPGIRALRARLARTHDGGELGAGSS